jgi:hypothetical protein
MENMSNTNDSNNLSTINRSLQDPLPPLPPVGAVGPEVCATIRLYLAVWQDLAPMQRRIVHQHIISCKFCRNEQQVYLRATQLIQSLPTSSPSVQVDRAVLAAIVARNTSHRSIGTLAAPPFKSASRKRSQTLWVAGSLAAAAMILIGFALMYTSFMRPSAEAFSIPTNLSWNNYVLFHKQVSTNAQGEQLEVMSYHNMSKDVVNVETVIQGKKDVVVLADGKQSLGLDMMKHVAQWDVKNPSLDNTYFDLDALRQDLHTGSAVYQGTATFYGQNVYRISYSDGHVLLLDMNYMPVNILPQASASATPVYKTVQWLRPSQVASSMWNINVPAGFSMGQVELVS